MRTIHICVVLFAVACSSKKKEEPAASAPVVTPAGSGSAQGSGSGAAPSGKQADDPYEEHMEAGEKLEDQKKWAEALTEFEAALAAKPDDPLALTEVGVNAFFAGKLDRAVEASEKAAATAKDGKVRGAALFNLGLAVEKDHPYAAAELYAAAYALRPANAIRARRNKLKKNKAAAKSTPEDETILAKVNVKAGASSSTLANAPANTDDQALIDALQAAGVEWESGAGKSVLLVENLECRENHQSKPTTYDCTAPAVKGKAAQALVGALVGKKLAPAKEHGDVVTYKASVRCRSFNEGESAEPDACEVTGVP
ncbi:MAG TPA: tetratricopeptide repeat protein [Kofleriaceae bacterium]|jgi:tetratricopeptide (TPR) repeat protein|nr:tetratricopeptide repeat protein [Kofleriaceae bacterium]